MTFDELFAAIRAEYPHERYWFSLQLSARGDVDSAEATQKVIWCGVFLQSINTLDSCVASAAVSHAEYMLDALRQDFAAKRESAIKRAQEYAGAVR